MSEERLIIKVLNNELSIKRAQKEALKAKKADTFSAIKSNLFELSGQLPGSRVLDGHYAIDQQGMAIPKGRDLALVYASKFVADAKSEGLVKRAVERSGLRGAIETQPR